MNFFHLLKSCNLHLYWYFAEVAFNESKYLRKAPMISVFVLNKKYFDLACCRPPNGNDTARKIVGYFELLLHLKKSTKRAEPGRAFTAACFRGTSKSNQQAPTSAIALGLRFSYIFSECASCMVGRDSARPLLFSTYISTISDEGVIPAMRPAAASVVGLCL
jgi:hypothetical protein